jgi:RNA polymerase sigma-70 factor, ECF subfamily
MTGPVSASAPASARPPSAESGRPERFDAYQPNRARSGDAHACDSLFRQHSGRMLVVASRLLQSGEDAADAVQEAFLSAFRSLDHFAGNSAFDTWLHQIVVNVCLLKLRSESGRRAVSLDDLVRMFGEDVCHRRRGPSGEERADAILARAETMARVRDCIERLAEPFRSVIVLRDIQELDTEQTARHLGISEAAVKTRLHRARRALRSLLEPFFLDGSIE